MNILKIIDKYINLYNEVNIFYSYIPNNLKQLILIELDLDLNQIINILLYNFQLDIILWNLIN